MLYHLGCMCFALPDTSNTEYEEKATAAMSALLKDMEAAQLMQEADSYSITCSANLPSSSSSSQAEQEEEHQEQYTNYLLRSFLTRPDSVSVMRQIQDASMEELAGGQQACQTTVSAVLLCKASRGHPTCHSKRVGNTSMGSSAKRMLNSQDEHSCLSVQGLHAWVKKITLDTWGFR